MKFIMVRETLANLNLYIITSRWHHLWHTAFVFPKEQFCSPSICSFFCDLIVALHRPIICVFFFWFPPSTTTPVRDHHMLRDVLCIYCLVYFSNLHPYIWKISLKLIKTAYALGRTAKECCKAHPSQRLNVPDIQCCPHDKLGFDFVSLHWNEFLT